MSTQILLTSQKYKELGLKKARTFEYMVEKYGKDEGKRRYISSRSRYTGLYYSKESQELFWIIYNDLSDDLKNRCYFAELNKEFNRFSEVYNQVFFYDFVIKDLLVIEYNGEHVHPNKDVLSIDEWCSWKQAYTKKSADEIFDIDLHKKELMVSLGYNYMTIWRQDWVSDSNKTLKTIKEKIYG